MRIHTLLATVALSALALSACGQAETKAKTETVTASGAASGETAAPATDGAPSLTVAPPAGLAVGKATTLTLSLKDAAGKPLGPDAIATSHTQKVHVMIVDAGLEDYTHAHATPGATPGEWTVPFTPKFGRTYKVWADFKLASAGGDKHAGHDMAGMEPKEKGHDHNDGTHAHDELKKDDAHPLTPSATLQVGTQAAPAVAAVQSLSGSAGGLKFSLSLAGAVKAGDHVAATLAVMDEATGQPFTGLEPIMGAYAHLVGFSADGATMLHGHPEGTEPKDAAARGGPTLTFELHPATAGPTRMFLQVQKGGQVVVVPFTLIVNP